MPRRICVVVASRANYARIKTALEAIRDHPELELQLVAGASLVLERFGNALDIVTQDGFVPDATIRWPLPLTRTRPAALPIN